MAHEALGASPIAHDDKDGAQGKNLTDFNANVERDEVGEKPVWCNLEFSNLCSKPKAVEQTENHGRDRGVGLKSEPSLISPEIVQGLVDHGQPDDGVNEVGADSDVKEDTDKQGGGVTYGKEADVNPHILEPIEIEYDPEEEEKVVISRHHVFGSEVDEGEQVNPGYFLDVPFVARGDTMGKSLGTDKNECKSCEEWPARAQRHAQPTYPQGKCLKHTIILVFYIVADRETTAYESRLSVSGGRSIENTGAFKSRKTIVAGTGDAPMG